MDSRLQRLIDLLNQLNDLINKLRDVQAEFRKRLDNAKLEELKKLVIDFLGRMDEIEKQEADVIKEALAIAQDLAKSPPAGEPPTTTPKAVKAGDVAGHFRDLIDTFQADARKPRDSETAATLKSLEIELKGLIVVEDNEAKIITPTPESKLDPNMLSTIRLAYGSIPVIRPKGPTENNP
jgi:hypothetical protein